MERVNKIDVIIKPEDIQRERKRRQEHAWYEKNKLEKKLKDYYRWKAKQEQAKQNINLNDNNTSKSVPTSTREE